MGTGPTVERHFATGLLTGRRRYSKLDDSESDILEEEGSELKDKKTFGEYIAQQRKINNLTQKELANQLFVTESAVSKWERGLSYPDISLVKPLCDVFHITEHELLTVSKDTGFHTTEKLARRYQKLITRYRWVVSLLLGIALVATFIVNLAVAHTLSWFYLVLAAELVAFSLLLLPTYFESDKGLVALLGFTLSLLGLLWVCNVYTGGNWFILAASGVLLGLSLVFLPYVLVRLPLFGALKNHKSLLYFTINTGLYFLLLLAVNWYLGGNGFMRPALFISLYCLVFVWAMMVIIRYFKINWMFKAAGCFGLSALFQIYVNGFIRWAIGETDRLEGLHPNFLKWGAYAQENSNAIQFVIYLGLALFFLIAGLRWSFKQAQSSKEETNKEQ